MKFDSCALAAISMTPKLKIIDHKQGKVTVIPVAPASSEVAIKFEDFTGEISIEWEVTMNAGGKTKVITAPVLVNNRSDTKTDEVAKKKRNKPTQAATKISTTAKDEALYESYYSMDDSDADQYSLDDDFRQMYFVARGELMMGDGEW